jgi:hypothetical protein
MDKSSEHSPEKSPGTRQAFTFALGLGLPVRLIYPMGARLGARLNGVKEFPRGIKPFRAVPRPEAIHLPS